MTTSPRQCAHQILDVTPMILQAIRQEMRKSSSAELTVPQFRTLAFLNRNPGASLSAAAEFIGLTLFVHVHSHQRAGRSRPGYTHNRQRGSSPCPSYSHSNRPRHTGKQMAGDGDLSGEAGGRLKCERAYNCSIRAGTSAPLFAPGATNTPRDGEATEAAAAAEDAQLSALEGTAIP